ncbi:uncharacterized protein plekho2 isoform X1 [Syngnathus acus]|uniref:uncharacterized protein plekho2 isoform X1 n=1 Tax=Syngnathus acus TaxID=161584 RepID=UPI001885EEC9|nr:uncharacterized protein plekho2 isoform X1 [Syngnathus acus]
MENATHDHQAPSNNPEFLGKAGWVKKAPCRLLASYKDSYIHVDKTAIAVYQNEDLTNCIESLDLQNYDKCHELKSRLMRKHRLILIRSPKTANEIRNIKFQVQTEEEKEAWIQALNDGINRAKNKVLDEVKMDENSNLQHLTRTRPKGNRNRRPPTRIHMKEVAELSSEGMLRLDLDLLNAAVPNGTYDANSDDTDMPRESNKFVLQCNFTEGAENLLAETQTDLKVLKLPIESPSSLPSHSSSPSSELAGNYQLKHHTHPPNPPPKDMKPSFVLSAPNQKAERPPDSNEDKQQENKNDTARLPQKKYQTLLHVGDGTTTCIEGIIMENDKAKIIPQMPGSKIMIPTERKTVFPPLSPNKKHSLSSKFNIQPIEVTTKSQEEEDHASWLKKLVCFSSLSNDSLLNDPTNYSQMFLPTPQEKRINSDNECVGWFQHLNAKSAVTGHENTFRMSKTAVSDSDTDVLNISSDGNLMQAAVTATTKNQSKGSMCRQFKSMPLSTKIRSVSFGNLLSDSSHTISSRCHSEAFMRNEVDLITLENELTLEMQETSELMSSVCQSHMEGDEASIPGNLLMKAMEKLNKADHVLKELKELKHTKTERKNTW